MKLDVEKLSEAELVDLNNRIVERLRFLREMRTHGQMLEFRVGDRCVVPPRWPPCPHWDAHPLQQEDGYRHNRTG